MGSSIFEHTTKDFWAKKHYEALQVSEKKMYHTSSNADSYIFFCNISMLWTTIGSYCTLILYMWMLFYGL